MKPSSSLSSNGYDSKRWVTLAEAAWWVRYRTERPESNGMHDIDRPAEVGSIGALREALGKGKIRALGRKHGRAVITSRGEHSYGDTAIEIPVLEWEWRIVGDIGDRFLAEPYQAIYLDRAAVMREFPAFGRPKIGRPVEYDWERIEALYAELVVGARQEDRGRIGTGKAAESLRSLCIEKLGHDGAPKITRLKEKIREWRTD